METAKEFFDEFLDMRECLPELVSDRPSSKVYKVDSDISYQANLRLYDSDNSNYFNIEINVSILKEDDSGEEIERMVIHILKDDKDKGNIYLRMYRWLRFYFIDVDKIKETIYGICRKYGIDSDFMDFECDLIKIIHDYCLGIYPYTIQEKNNNNEEFERILGPDIIECINQYGYKVYNIKAADDSQASIIIKRHGPDDECENGYDILVNTTEKEGDILISKTNTEKFLIDTDGLISNFYIFDKENGLYKHINERALFDDHIEGHFPKLLDAELRYAIYEIYFKL